MKVRLSFAGSHLNAKSGGQRKKVSDFLKPEYLGKVIEIDNNDRSSVVRAFMDTFLVRDYSSREIQTITHFLNRYHLSRAEIHAVVLHLGYRYNTGNKALRHLAIDGYFDNHPSKSRKP